MIFTKLSDIEYCLHINYKMKFNQGYKFKSKFHVSTTNKADKELFKHPTIKPVELVKKHLLHATQEGDVVLDCFLGSGTTALACKEIDRQYIGIEKNEEFYNIAVDRINGITADNQTSIFTDFDMIKV